MRRFCFLHPRVNNVADFKKYLKIGDELDEIDLVWDMDHPEICFATEVIFANLKYWKLFKTLSQISKVNVFYSKEAMTIDFNIFDIGMTFDNTINGERYCQILPPEESIGGFLTKSENEIRTPEQAFPLLKGRKFCNFLYSNYNAHPIRDQLFFKISEYKRIDSMGKHLNNVGVPGTGWYGHAMDCVKIKSNYKFSIACENASFPGYTSEKLLTSLEAHTVPIYFGNKDADLDVNPECYINVMEYHTLEELIEKIKEVDTHDDLWCEMVSKPWYASKQLELKAIRRKDYYDMLKRIFTENIEHLMYRGVGPMENRYREFYYKKGPRNIYISYLILFKQKLTKEYFYRWRNNILRH